MSGSSLEEAVFWTRDHYPTVSHLRDYADNTYVELPWKAVMRTLIAARADLYAFEVSDGDAEKRVAWRRWPAQGTPAYETALRLHARAAQWADDEG